MAGNFRCSICHHWSDECICKRMGNVITETTKYIIGIQTILSNMPLDDIDNVIEALKKARKEGRRIFIMGNGGSGSTASHITSDLMKGCDMGDSIVLCLNDNMATFSAWANDECYELVFSWQIEKMARAKDVVMIISGSGKSRNVVLALQWAKGRGLSTIALTGFDGGDVKDYADISVIVPSDNMQQIEDVHLMIGHMIATAMKEK